MPHYEEKYKIIIEDSSGNSHESQAYTNNPEHFGFIPPLARLSVALEELGKNGGFYIDKEALTAYPVKRVYVKKLHHH